MRNNYKFRRLVTLVSFVVFFLWGQSAWGQVSLTSVGTPFTQNFNGIGSSGTVTLPSGWKVNSTTSYSTAASATTLAYGTSGTGAVTGTSGGGVINWANGVTASSTDRAIGFLTSGGFTSPRYLFVQVTNNTGSTIASLNISFDIEKYRSGSRAWDIKFFSSTDGSTWTAQTSGDQTYIADANNNNINDPPTSISKSVTINGLSIVNGTSYYFYWGYIGNGGSTNAQGLGIDNFSITATAASPVISTTGTLSAVNTTYGTASASPTTFSVSGTNMTAGILVTPPTGYEVSLTSGSGYAATVTVGVAGTISSTPVYVRLKSTTSVGSYSGNIVCSSSGATSVNVATVSSSVSAKALTVTANNVTKTFGATLTSGAGSTEFTSSGLVNSETIGSVTITYGTGAAAGDAIGSYPLQVTPSSAIGGTFNSSNYTITYVSGDITVTSASEPEINIQESSTDYFSGNTFTFGSIVSGTSSITKTFTIQNNGNANLTLTGTPIVDISGTNASEFAIVQPVSTTIAASGSTTFTITFNPTSQGSKTATISIANNDATGSENPYIINLTGTGTVSSASDIITKLGYVYHTNIAYSTYNTGDIIGGANDIEIAQFTIRDGGVTTDADNLGTTLSQIVFSVTNYSNIRRIAIYDGITEVCTEQAGAATVTFSGLNLLASDGGTKDFSVRASFNTTVTDNQQVQLTVTATTSAATTGSGFAASDAGSATTSISGDDNRIEVSATKLKFVQQPTNTTINVAMAPSVSIESADNNNNRDFDYGTDFSITSSGTLSGTTVTSTPVLGLATFGSLTHTVIGSSLQLTAASGSLTSALSSNFDITNGTIYFHDFGVSTFSTKPYTVAPVTFATNLNTSSWTTSAANFGNLSGSSGGSISINNSSGTPTFTLTFNVATGYQLDINAFDFWRVRSSSGAQNWAMTINGISIGTGSIPSTGASIGMTNVSNTISGLTGSITIIYTMSGASGSGTCRLDDFTLYGTVSLAPQPEIDIQGNGISIADGDITPDAADGTDFENVEKAGGTTDKTFTIYNTGTTTLTLSGSSPYITISGTNAGDFSIVTPPSNTIAVGGSSSFTVRFDPSALGTRTATLTITNNDLTEGTYDFAIQGTGTTTHSSSSNIIRNTVFSEPDNIAYDSYQENTDLTFANSLEVAKFDVQDGGGSADGDALSTSLTAVGFTITNYSLIRRLAIYDGSTEIAEVPVIAGTVSFSSLTGLVAADDGNKSFSLRASFNSAVTDNQQFSFAVNSATADEAGSVFTTSNAGAAVTSNTGDDNRIEVTATKLDFTTAPSTSVCPSINFATPPVVTARDANNNTDLDFVSQVTITNSGGLSMANYQMNAVSGIANFSALQFTQTGSASLTTSNGDGLTNATATSLITASVTDVSGATATAGTGQVTIVWTNPACYSEIMIVAALTSNTGTPSGDGSSYSANLVYGNGTALGNGFVVYKGSTSSQIVTALTNGTTYYFKIYTLSGTVWSSGIEKNATPVAAAIGLATYNFTTANATSVPANLAVSALSQGNNNGATTLISGTSASFGYTGTSGGNNAASATFDGSFSSSSTYYEFTLTPSSDYKVQLTSISFGTRSTGSGPVNYKLRSSLDNYASDIASGPMSANSSWVLKSNTGLSAISDLGTAVTFRIYGYGGSGAAGGTANWRIDDLNLTGYVTFGCITPTTQASNVTFSTVTSNSMTVSWNRGSTPGNGVLVLIKQGTAVDANPVDGTSYTASPVSPFGSEIGTGNYVIYLASGTSVNLTGLTQNTAYYVNVYEKNCLNTTLKVNTTLPATGNVTTREPLSGVYSINTAAATSGRNYQTFTAAINDLNLLGISGAVTFEVFAGDYAEDLPVITTTGTATNTITFVKKTTSPTIKPTGTAGVQLLGVDYYTFNGINIEGGNSVNYGYYLNAATVTDGCQNNTIKNCVVSLNKSNLNSCGIYTNSSATVASGTNSFNKFYNNTIDNCYSAYQLLAASSLSVFDMNNEIGTEAAGSSLITNIGGGSAEVSLIKFSYQNGLKIFNTDMSAATGNTGNVYGIYSNVGSSSAATYIYGNNIHDLTGTSSSVYGIYITSGTTNNIYNNTIHAISTSTTGNVFGIGTETGSINNNIYSNKIYNISCSGNANVYGIDVSAGVTHTIYNNIIYDLSAVNSNSDPGVKALSARAGTVNIYYNTVYLADNATPVNSTACLYASGGSTALDIRNNIFINTTITNSSYNAYAFYKLSSGVTNSNANNNFYVTPSSSNHIIFATGTSTSSVVTPIDNATVNSNVAFVSSTDFHIDATNAANGAIRKKGTPINGFTTDYDGDIRNTTSPDIGADELNITITWDGAAWSNIAGPTVADNAIINGDYTINTSFDCLDLNIVAGKQLQIQNGKFVKVNGTLTNNNGVNGILVKHGGNLLHTTVGVQGSVELNLTGGGTYNIDKQWHQIGTPISNPSIGLLSGNTVYTYKEDGTSDGTAWNTYSLALQSVMGYLFYSATATTKTFAGDFNVGTMQSYELAYTNDYSSGAYKGFNMVSNPYPATIDWSVLYLLNNLEVEQTIWIWNPNPSKYGYAVWDGTTSINDGSQFIPACQGFFVKARSASKQLVFNNTMKTTTSGVFMKKSMPVANLLKLKISDNKHSDETAVYFTTETSGSAKLYSMSSSIPQIYIKDAANEYAIARFANPVVTKDVNLNVYCGISGKFMLSVSDFTFADNVVVTLEDLKTKTITSITKTSTYYFDYVVNESPNRFIVHIKPFGNPTAIQTAKDDAIKIYSSGKFIYIDNERNTVGKVNVFDALGKQICTEQMNGNQTRIDLSSQSAGIYFIQYKNAGFVKTQKVMIQ